MNQQFIERLFDADQRTINIEEVWTPKTIEAIKQTTIFDIEVQNIINQLQIL